MKRTLAFLLAIVFVCLSAVSVFAATRKDVVDYALEHIPAKYDLYHIWAQNILGQYDLSAEEWDEVLLLVEELVTSFPSDEGASLHEYSSAQRAAALSALKSFCEITDSTFLIRDVANAKHSGDQEVLLYKEDGTLVAVVDGDLHPDTTGLSVNNTWLVLSACLLVSALGVFVLRRRVFAA